MLHLIGQNLDENIQTDILYLDFAKTFDSVDHNLIKEKLKLFGKGWFLIGFETILIIGLKGLSWKEYALAGHM